MSSSQPQPQPQPQQPDPSSPSSSPPSFDDAYTHAHWQRRAYVSASEPRYPALTLGTYCRLVTLALQQAADVRGEPYPCISVWVPIAHVIPLMRHFMPTVQSYTLGTARQDALLVTFYRPRPDADDEALDQQRSA